MFDWTKNLDSFPLNPPFTGETGFSFPTENADVVTPFALYSRFIDRDMVRHIKAQTYLYASQGIGERERTMYSCLVPFPNLEDTEVYRLI